MSDLIAIAERKTKDNFMMCSLYSVAIEELPTSGFTGGFNAYIKIFSVPSIILPPLAGGRKGRKSLKLREAENK